MNRDEILAKSREENKKRDERDRYFDKIQEHWAGIAMVFCICVLMIYDTLHGNDILKYICLIFACGVGETAAIFAKKRNIRSIVEIVLMSVIFIGIMIYFLTGHTIVTNISGM